MRGCMRVCVCARARVRARACAHASVRGEPIASKFAAPEAAVFKVYMIQRKLQRQKMGSEPLSADRVRSLTWGAMMQLERAMLQLSMTIAMLAGVADGFMPLLASRAVVPRFSPHLPVSVRSSRSSLPFARRRVAAEIIMNAAAMPNVWSQSVRKDMEAMGATYCILWQKKGDVFVVVQDYTTEARRKAMRRVRGDDKLFATESRRYTLPVNGTGPIATAARKNMQVTIKDTSQMQRADLAKEFGIKVYRM